MKFKLNWGTGLIVFFAIFFIWVFSFVFFAMRQNTDLVSDDYYQKGAKYTDQININKRSAAYKDSLQICFAGDQIQIGLCKSMVTKGDTIQLYFYRSSDKAKDLQLTIKNADSPLLIDKNRLSHGRYQVFASWDKNGEKYMVKQVLDIE